MKDGAISGVTRVLGVWVVLAAIIGAVWRTRITATVDAWFLLCMFLGASALMAPVYGGFVYFGARRRDLPRMARAAGITTITLFVVGLICAGLILWLLKALSALR